MVLVIDNYDSFTYNLVQYLGELGAELRVARNDEITVDEIAALRPDHIVISPGPGTPDDGGISNEVIRRLGPTTPILGVCLGHQCMGPVSYTHLAFRALARGPANLIPVTREFAADLETPVSVYLKLMEEPGASFLLESVEGGEQVGRYSFVGVGIHRRIELHLSLIHI